MLIELALAAALQATPQPYSRSYYNGNEFWQACGPASDRTGRTACGHYVMGVIDTLAVYNAVTNTPPAACVPEEVTGEQALDVVLAHYERHPEERHFAAASSVIGAINAAFPCTD